MSAARGWSRAAGARVWRGARRRWLLGGVLCALLAAVLAPRLGAPGGNTHAQRSLARHHTPPCTSWGLRAEYSSWALVAYVHYSAGRRARGAGGALCGRARALGAAVAHAHVVVPALTAALLCALTDGVDYRIVQGVMLWSLGGGCAWLPLALCAGGSGRAAPGGCALVYVASLLATPLHTALLCGRAALPAPAGVLVTLGTAAAPFAAGAWLPLPAAPSPAAAAAAPRGAQLAALALLYCECCERLCDAEAILYLGDVLVALALEVCCVLVSAAWVALYARAGLLSRADARLVALCALPRSLDTRWSMACAARGMCRLPGVFVAPAQALLLAALAPADLDDELPQHAAPPASLTTTPRLP
ncbi:hypothetical protein PYW07_009820 [Mythimna separata]|uniref:Uncharacterized protein n=1 Tax=Mythimna separata TaxID=271217 RepID=A0AAD8DR42_MYTSE|nr:hypothetical protein PYW07_009820 [Mythimna separata]